MSKPVRGTVLRIFETADGTRRAMIRWPSGTGWLPASVRVVEWLDEGQTVEWSGQDVEHAPA